MKVKENIWDKIERIPREFYYTILLASLCLVLVNPIGLPIAIEPDTLELYNYIENLPPDSVIIFDIAFGAGGAPELGPMMEAVMHHLFTKPIKIIVITLYEEGPLMYQRYFVEKLKPEIYGKEYGKDYCFLGYTAGGETAIATFARDMQYLKYDYKGTPLSELPVMKNIKNASDIAAVITFTTAGPSSPAIWVRQWASPYKVPILTVILTMMVPANKPYYEAGLLKAIVPAGRAAAEYELLVKKPGYGLRSTDAITVSHIITIALVILGNAGLIAKKFAKKR